MALNNCANIKIHRDNFHGLPVLYMFKGMKYCRFFSQKMKKRLPSVSLFVENKIWAVGEWPFSLFRLQLHETFTIQI